MLDGESPSNLVVQALYRWRECTPLRCCTVADIAVVSAPHCYCSNLLQKWCESALCRGHVSVVVPILAADVRYCLFQLLSPLELKTMTDYLWETYGVRYCQDRVASTHLEDAGTGMANGLSRPFLSHLWPPTKFWPNHAKAMSVDTPRRNVCLRTASPEKTSNLMRVFGHFSALRLPHSLRGVTGKVFDRNFRSRGPEVCNKPTVLRGHIGPSLMTVCTILHLYPETRPSAR